MTRLLVCAPQVDDAKVLDLRGMPPALAEVYVLSVLHALEKRAARKGSDQFFYNVRVGGKRGRRGRGRAGRAWGR